MKGQNKLEIWSKENKVVLIYLVFTICVEMITVGVVEHNPIITQPFIELGILIIIVAIGLLIKKNIIRVIFLSLALILQSVLDLAFVVIHDMTGQYFDYGMLNLRNDAFGILESIPMNFIVFYTAVFFCIFFVIFSVRSIKKKRINDYTKKEKISYILMIFAGVTVVAITIYVNNSKTVDKYEKMLMNKQSGSYSTYGIVGNTVNEFAKGLIFNETEKLSCEEIDGFIYENISEPTKEFGVSKDNNVIVILVESYEWFAMMKTKEYPNALNLTEEEYEYLFPNLYKFYNESVVMNNFHSKEKTDISEALSILGSYPRDSYISYDYAENVMPHTLPNVLKILTDGNIECNSFHDGFKSFYNREKSHKSFGFEKLTDSYDMYDMSDAFVKAGTEDKETMHDYMTEGERNLDSQMIYTCKDLMFPTDTRFFTYITSITMHGIYYERENLSGHKEKLMEVVKSTDNNNEDQQNLINYMTSVMEFDDALGIMMKDLEEKGLLENTTIVLFGDHNAYYQQLSNYVKEIYDFDTENYYTDLYKVPFMIYDKNISPQVIDKFTCTADIVPSLMDILGIRYYSNMYYGNSVFSEEESVLYSRAYGFFAGEGVIALSLRSISYKAPSVKNEYMEAFGERATQLVEKIKYCDQIFYQDYFRNDANYGDYLEKIKEIN